MQTLEISFATLRKHYIEVREFLITNTGLRSNEIGVYSSLSDNLLIDDDDISDMMLEFFKKNEIFFEDNQSKVPTWVEYMLLILLISTLIFVLIESIYYWQITLIILIILSILSSLINQYPKSNFIKIPNKKEWNPESLSVADLVCMAITKKEVYKKDINFVLKKRN